MLGTGRDQYGNKIVDSKYWVDQKVCTGFPIRCYGKAILALVRENGKDICLISAAQCTILGT